RNLPRAGRHQAGSDPMDHPGRGRTAHPDDLASAGAAEASTGEGSTGVNLMTSWGESLSADAVLQEYPRPQLVRDSYLNLNGHWDYAIVPARGGSAPPVEWDGKFLVPFSPEAPLSGVGRQLKPDETLWYRRELTLPDGFALDKVLLHFGAVDQDCAVYLNGTLVGAHSGGYLPFAIDVTEALRSGTNELTVEVHDVSDTAWHSRGKQKLKRGGIWYTAQSGIWQTVWLESVPHD